MKKMRNKLAVIAITLLSLSGCSAFLKNQPTQSLTPTVIPTIIATETQTPTLTITPTSNPIEEYLHRLPLKPDGFEWKYVPEVSMAVLIPDGWFYKYEYRDDIEIDSFYVTKENIDEVGRFSTGVTVFVFSDDPDPDSLSIQLLTVNATVDTTKRIIGSWDYDTGLGIIHHMEIESEFPYETEINQHKIIHYLSLSYNGKVFYCFFESPASIWEEMKKDYGAKILDNLAILD